MKKNFITEEQINEGFPGISGGGFNPTFAASYGVQGSNDTYSYQIFAFNDTLQQKPNENDNRYYIGPNSLVRGVGYSNPDYHYTGRVVCICKNENGEIVAIKIRTNKTNRMAYIRPDENLELIINKPQPTDTEFVMIPSYNMDVNKK